MLRNKVLVLGFILSLLAIGLFAQNPDWLWAKSAGGADDEITRASAIDAAGNSYVTGFFVGTAVFGTTTLTSNDNTNCFVAKMDSNGNWLWAKSAVDTGNCEAMDIAVDALSNVYIVGNFNGSANFGVTPINSGGLIDIFIAKLDTDGDWIWAKQAGGTFNDNAMSIDLDNSSNVYITGNFDRNATFGTTTLTVQTSKDVFIAKLSTDGLWAWAVQAGGLSNDFGTDIAVNSIGDSFITGYFSGTMAFGDSTLTSRGSNDIFVAKLDTAGSWYGAAQAGGTGNDHAEHIALDNAGNCYVTGEYNGTAIFGDFSFSDYGGFVAKLDAGLNWLWLKQSNGSTMCDLTVDNAQNVYLTGGFFSIAIFGTITIYGTGSSDVFVAKLSNTGNWQWVQQAGGTGEDYGMGIGLDSAGNIYLAGHFYNTCAFGATNLASSGQKEIFVAKLNGSTAIADEVYYPVAPFALAQNYPNPFGTSTKITIDVKDNNAAYELTIYDLKGRKISTLHKGMLSKGENCFTWSGKEELPSGIYYYQLKNGSSVVTKKMVLIR